MVRTLGRCSFTVALAAALPACGGAPVAPRELSSSAPASSSPPSRLSSPSPSLSSSPASSATVAREGGRMGVHGMIVFGGSTVFASHIPMFSPPHDVQLVLEIDVGAHPSFSDELFTLQPRAFSLDDLIAGTRTSFEAELYRGNFEDGGKRIGTVHVTVKRILLKSSLSAAAPSAPGAPAYFLFGSAREAFLVRALAAPSDRDQVLRVSVVGGGLDDRLAAGTRVTLVGGEPRLAARTYALGDGTRVRVDRELSCLVGPEFAKACE